MKNVLAAGALVFAGLAQASEAPRVQQLSWMTGCWGYSGGGSSYEEVWLSPTQNSILGMSRRVSDDGITREFEFMRIVTSGGGGFDFVAQPGGNPPVRFNSLEIKPTRVVFDNPLHDYPQKISYEFRAPDQLFARIEGKDNGQAATTTFPMKRKACEPQ